MLLHQPHWEKLENQQNALRREFSVAQHLLLYILFVDDAYADAAAAVVISPPPSAPKQIFQRRFVSNVCAALMAR